MTNSALEFAGPAALFDPPSRWTSRQPFHSLRLQHRAFRGGLSAFLPGGFAARRAEPAPLGGRTCRPPLRAVRRAGCAAAQGELSPGLSRREPRALRARPAHVRRAAPRLREHPLDARRRRARHGSAGRRRWAGDLCPGGSPPPRRSPDRGVVQALPPGATRADPAHRPQLRPLHPDRLPLHALDQPRPGRREGGRDPRRPVRHRLCPALIDAFEAQFLAQGFRVVRNKPYAGGFITEHYGEPNLGRHALQIELNRGLYMNESSLALTANFPLLVESLTTIVSAVSANVGLMLRRGWQRNKRLPLLCGLVPRKQPSPNVWSRRNKKGHSRRSGPKSREETPKKGSRTATPSRSCDAQTTVRRTKRKKKLRCTLRWRMASRAFMQERFGNLVVRSENLKPLTVAAAKPPPAFRQKPQSFSSLAISVFTRPARSFPLEGVSEVRDEEAELRTGVVGPPLVAHAEERLVGHQIDHRVGELDLAAGSLLAVLQDGKISGWRM